MDMRHSIKAARAAFFIAVWLGLVAPAWTQYAFASGTSKPPRPGAGSLVYGQDYRFPAQSSGGFIVSAASHAQTGATQSSAKSPNVVQYQAINGQTFNLVEHRGFHVAVLLPETPPAGIFFTADHVTELVDRLDILYTQYAAIMHTEPQGQGLLNVAFVPQTCGSGCALVGYRGIELLAADWNYEPIIEQLDAGQLPPILVHEMAHNFDTLSAFMHYLPEHVHAWTDLFEYFGPFRYARMGSRDQTPDELFDSPVRAVWVDYLRYPEASWEKCALDEACAGLTANSVWAMIYYRIEALYGRTALLESFAFMAGHARSNTPPVSAEAKESLRVLSLGIGAGANIACVMDQLNWPVSATVRSELSSRFGADNPVCADADGDGYSAVTGDCDEARSGIHPQASEVPGNGRDDDCDQRIDELRLAESSSGDDFRGTVSAKVPLEVAGTSANLDDFDTFTFPLPSSSRVRVTLCARDGFNGWVMALQPDGTALTEQNWFIYRSGMGCSSNSFDFSGLVTGTLSVTANDSAGAYELTVNPAEAMPPELAASFAITARTGGGMSVEIHDTTGSLAGWKAGEVEVSIPELGFELRRPFNPGMRIDLTSQTTPQLQDGAEYQLRLRPISQGLPRAAYSAGQRFRYDRTARALPAVDDTLSGAWFDPAHDGEGFIVQGLGAGRAVVYWFSYDHEGRQRWLLGNGTIKGNRLQVDTLLDTKGARFGDAFRAEDVELQAAGSLSISFLDCASAYVNYTVDNVGGSQSVGLLSDAFGHSCPPGEPPPALDLSGSWYDPGRNGEGFIVQQVDANKALVFWFTYDDNGRQKWVFNTGSALNGRITVTGLLEATGARFGRSFRPQDVTLAPWGNLELDLTCAGGTARWSNARASDSSGTLNLVPLTRLQDSGCWAQ